MIFAKGKSYKLLEMGGALIITESNVNVGDGSKANPVQPLIVADAGPLLTYMDRYFFERERGLALREAHDLAMKTAQITTVIPKDTKLL